MSIQQYGRQFPILLRMANPRGHVELLETIGKGNYGFVYKGKMLRKNNELAAVKVVFLKEDEIKETLLEMEILQSCNHPNITRYLGCFLKSLDFWVKVVNRFVWSIAGLDRLIPFTELLKSPCRKIKYRRCCMKLCWRWIIYIHK